MRGSRDSLLFCGVQMLCAVVGVGKGVVDLHLCCGMDQLGVAWSGGLDWRMAVLSLMPVLCETRGVNSAKV